ncbi:hypothetical protein CR513_62741 [Mucuna pruriens]|uniref:Uncharacterized protein n=1 Tax=Mucuna pruriens TaxID=157652 RepID=A0A371DZM2_MUCPR|nr:hypothetical protein CR513_62741 [Mucuna pruriens]
MSNWSPENAKRAYLQALKMAKRGKEPDVAEFISALAAGNSAQLMVVAGAGVAGSAMLALAVAAHQTGGRVVCICCDQIESHESRKALGVYGDCVEVVVGDVKSLLLGDYKGADFVLVDCDITNAREVFVAAFKGANKDGAVVVGYNVKHRASRWRQLRASFLPIGEGLLVAKIDPNVKGGDRVSQRSRWIVQVDNCTGEEHIFRVTSPSRKDQMECKELEESGTGQLLSGMAAGWKAKFIVETWSANDPIDASVGLAIAASNTDARHVCIVPDEWSKRRYIDSMEEMGVSPPPEMVVGEAETVVERMVGLDFLVVDCELKNFSWALRSAKVCPLGAIFACKNAPEDYFNEWRVSGMRVLRSDFLPVDKGLSIAYIASDTAPAVSIPPTCLLRWKHPQSGNLHFFQV